MSLNDHPGVRRLFKEFKIQAVALKYSCMAANSGARGRGEPLISNY